jgi:hypothetical protein
MLLYFRHVLGDDPLRRRLCRYAQTESTESSHDH